MGFHAKLPPIFSYVFILREWFIKYCFTDILVLIGRGRELCCSLWSSKYLCWLLQPKSPRLLDMTEATLPWPRPKSLVGPLSQPRSPPTYRLNKGLALLHSQTAATVQRLPVCYRSSTAIETTTIVVGLFAVARKNASLLLVSTAMEAALLLSRPRLTCTPCFQVHGSGQGFPVYGRDEPPCPIATKECIPNHCHDRRPPRASILPGMHPASWRIETWQCPVHHLCHLVCLTTRMQWGPHEATPPCRLLQCSGWRKTDGSSQPIAWGAPMITSVLQYDMSTKPHCDNVGV